MPGQGEKEREEKEEEAEEHFGVKSIVSGTSSPEVDSWYVSRIGFYVARGMKEGTEHLLYIPFRASGP